MIYVGTSGYSYKDWIGPFYPEGTKQPGMLEYYAQYFPCVEINATYYSVMSEKSFAGMSDRTPKGFRFSIKMPGAVTHLPKSKALRVPDEAREFRENIEPMREAKKLSCILMQFPNSFRNGDAAHEYLEHLREAFKGITLVAEFRNREWQTNETLKLLDRLSISWCNVDEPQFKGLLKPGAEVTDGRGYVRFHGRNYQQWWKGDNETRYDYSYSTKELEPWVDRVGDLEAEVKETLAFFNNHRRGQSVENAEMFTAMLQTRFGDRAAEVGEKVREAVKKTVKKRT
ncbi:MAG: DUF72 domain-containing protein [Candidatus Eremiobacteraeota bacterium]|nr:DUF72 domain-containing protein [Candidatus Eremiobacteraeota bacterium]